MTETRVQIREMRCSPHNLTRHLGLPCGVLRGDPGGWWGSWMDHYKLERVQVQRYDGDKDYIRLVSEPYKVYTDDLRQIVRLCETYGLEVCISGNAEHNSACCRIEISHRGKAAY